MLAFSFEAFSSKCESFLRRSPSPLIVGQFVTTSVQNINLDMGGLLGGVHYLEDRSVLKGQIGVRYTDVKIEGLISGYLTQTLLNESVPGFLSGRIIEDHGELILEVSRNWDKEGLEFDPNDSKIIPFPVQD